jgi:serine/threonine protein kinase
MKIIIPFNDDSYNNELTITNKIKNNIKNYNLFFYVYETNIPLTINNFNTFDFNEEEENEDDLFNGEKENNKDDFNEQEENDNIVKNKYVLLSFPENKNILNIKEYFFRITIKEIIMEIFEIYNKIKKIINTLHKINIIHKNISTDNILINIQTKSILLKNFTKSKVVEDNIFIVNEDFENLNIIIKEIGVLLNDKIDSFPLKLFLESIFFYKNNEDYNKYFLNKISDKLKKINNNVKLFS